MYITVAQWVPLVLALASGCVSIWLAFRRSSYAATTAGGLCVILLLISNLSQLEKFSGLGVQATMRKNLDDSNKIYARIKSLTTAFLDLSYQTVEDGIARREYAIQTGLDWLEKLDEIRKDQNIDSDALDKSRSALRKQIYTRMIMPCRRFISLAIYGDGIVTSGTLIIPTPVDNRNDIISQLSIKYAPIGAYDKSYEEKYLNYLIAKCSDEAIASMQSQRLTPKLQAFFSANSQNEARLASGVEK